MTEIFTINEIFYAPQGEGVRAGEPSIFIRFSGCNLTCNGQEDGEAYQPICDTEFTSGRKMGLDEIFAFARGLSQDCKWLVLTGGEPALQVTQKFIDWAHEQGFKLAIETNGTKLLPNGLDWICVSPKTAEHTLAQLATTEVKYVRHYGQGIPKTRIKADYYLISPALENRQISRKTLDWCVKLCLENPQWRLSVQQHHGWNQR